VATETTNPNMTPTTPASSAEAFPATPRVLYSRNPLIEVVCQLRYPAILKIDSEIPASFQERLRASFPLLAEEEEETTVEIPEELARLLRSAKASQSTRRIWRFASEDELWTVGLTRDSVSLSTESYAQWEEFRSKLALILTALHEEYHPSFINRIGLRYRDLILRSKLGLKDVSWSELLKAHIAAAYTAAPFYAAINNAAHVVNAEFPSEKTKLGLRHGTARNPESEEAAYLIDIDFYTEEKTEVKDALDRLDHFNRMAGRLFRWCITDKLHEAMEPKPL
jgi:uncharacterized protein (TIGR04255 family)